VNAAAAAAAAAAEQNTWQSMQRPEIAMTAILSMQLTKIQAAVMKQQQHAARLPATTAVHCSSFSPLGS